MLEYNHKYKIYRHPTFIKETFINGIKVTINCKWDKPKWISHAGISYHLENLMELGLDHDLAYVLTIDPSLSDEQIEDFLSFTQFERNEIIEMYHPFQGNFTINGLISTMKLKKEKFNYIKSFKYFAQRVEIFEHISSSQKRKFINSILTDKDIDFIIINIRHDRYIKNLKKIEFIKIWDEYKIICMLVFGCYKESMKEWCKSLKNDLNIVNNFIYLSNTFRCYDLEFDLKRLNFKYVKGISYHNREFLFKLGFKHKEINKNLYNLEKPKEMKIKFIERMVETGRVPMEDIVEYYGLDNNICNYIPIYTENQLFFRNLFLFLKRNKKQLEKKKTVYGPNGQTVEMHIHTLVRYITPDILTDHTIGWDTVMEKIEEVEKEKLKKQFGDLNKPLFSIKTKTSIPKDIRQIKTIGELKEEGNKMNHCVFSYAEACLHNTMIFHVGPPAPYGATAEVSYSREGFTVHQVRGFNNDKEQPLDEIFIQRINNFVDEENRVIKNRR